MEVSRELPPGKEKPLETKRFAQLLSAAIEATLEDLRKFSVPQKLQRFNLQDKEGIQPAEITAPDYRNEIVHKYFNDIFSSKNKELITVIDYLWERGALKIKLIGPDPDKASWGNWTLFKIVAAPLLVALKRTAKEHLFDRGKVASWAIDQDKIQQAIEDVVALYGKHSQLITAFCPLGGVKLPSDGCQDIASDIRLCKWTDRDVCLFLDRHGLDFLWDDIKSPWINRNLAEISFPIEVGPKIKQTSIVEQVQSCLDLLKWSLLLAKDQEVPVSEGTCVLTARLDKRGGRFRRDENLECGNYPLDLSDIKTCGEFLKNFRSAREILKRPDELDQALWHFGRSCVASLPRDVLVEAVMGLDAILVSGSGEANYKFSLHGATLLSGYVSDGEKIHKILKKFIICGVRLLTERN